MIRLFKNQQPTAMQFVNMTLKLIVDSYQIWEAIDPPSILLHCAHIYYTKAICNKRFLENEPIVHFSNKNAFVNYKDKRIQLMTKTTVIIIFFFFFYMIRKFIAACQYF